MTQALKVHNQTVIPELKIAAGFVTRLVGLMGRQALRPSEGIFFPRCTSIHTCFMRFPIDVVFVNKQGAVVAVEAAVPPWRLLLPKSGAAHIIELGAHRAEDLGIRPGAQLSLKGVWD